MKNITFIQAVSGSDGFLVLELEVKDRFFIIVAGKSLIFSLILVYNVSFF